ncbi:MerC domain-containing protein [Parasphingorhabdus sp. JC815]|uniref:MerC domain-containing protein n=1 Tax=Parasphingorhabdus sp. JC815 TaxID=3232140 RepID=UPI003459ADD6
MPPTPKLWNKGDLLAKDGLWDRIAVLISGLCLVHCVSTLILVALISSAAGVLLDPIIHEIGICIAIILGLIALGRGIMDHGFLVPAIIGGLGLAIMAAAITIGHQENHGSTEIFLTMAGVGILAIGHNLNYRAGR